MRFHEPVKRVPLLLLLMCLDWRLIEIDHGGTERVDDILPRWVLMDRIQRVDVIMKDRTKLTNQTYRTSQLLYFLTTLLI